MSETVRAFLAVELPEAVRAALAEVVERLRQERLQGVRAVNPESVHITLKFLGEVEQDSVGRLVDALTPVADKWTPFIVTTGVVGAFPNNRAPRVVWVGIGGDAASLVELHAQLDGVLDTLGFPRDGRRFTPHLTVARIRGAAARAAGPRAAAVAAEAWRGADLFVPVESITLMRSLLSPQGARHQPLSRMRFGAGKSP